MSKTAIAIIMVPIALAIAYWLMDDFKMFLAGVCFLGAEKFLDGFMPGNRG